MVGNKQDASEKRAESRFREGLYLTLALPLGALRKVSSVTPPPRRNGTTCLSHLHWRSTTGGLTTGDNGPPLYRHPDAREMQ